MKNIITIFKKEIYRVFSDKRLLLTVLVLPGAMFYLIYSFMGSAFTDIGNDIEEHKSIVVIDDCPTGFSEFLNTEEDNKAIITYVTDTLYTDYENQLLEGTIDIYIDFPEDFITVLENYENTTEAPNVLTYHNSGENYSRAAYNDFIYYLSHYKETLLKERMSSPEDINAFTLDVDNDNSIIVEEDKATGTYLAMMLPFLIITFIFSSILSLGPDSIAGEKERGTISTLLITPIKRSELAFGKVISLSVLSGLSTLSSFIGIILSFRKIMTGLDGTSINKLYGFTDYVLLLIVLITLVLLLVSLVSLISSFAKTAKEATMYCMPLYMVVIVVSITSMIGQMTDTKLFMYLIPVYGSVQGMSSIFSFDIEPVGILLVILSNFIYTAIIIVLLNKTFNSEKIMFSK